jgi:hypothetical protein
MLEQLGRKEDAAIGWLALARDTRVVEEVREVAAEALGRLVRGGKDVQDMTERN